MNRAAFHELVDRCLEGGATDEEYDRLVDAARGSEELAALLDQHAEVDALLRASRLSADEVSRGARARIERTGEAGDVARRVRRTIAASRHAEGRARRGSRRSVASITLLALAAAAVVVLGISYAPTDHPRRGAPQIASIAELDGEVLLVTAGRTSRARAGLQIAPGQSLRTDVGMARVRYDDDTAVELLDRSELAFEDARPAGAKELRLTRGCVIIEAAPQPDGRPMTVRTPHISVRVVGTRFQLAVGRATRLDVDEGRVEVDPGDGAAAVPVRAGQYVTSAGGVMPIPRAIASAHTDPAAVGPFPAEVATWDDATRAAQIEDGRRLIEAITRAANAGRRRFVAPRGQYRFDATSGVLKTHITLADLRDFEVDFNGSTFWFTHHATGLSLWRCRDATFRNLVVDWDPLPYTQGAIESIDGAADTVVVRIDEGYTRVTDRLASKDLRGAIHAAVVDRATDSLREGVGGLQADPFWSSLRDDRTCRIHLRPHHGVPLADLPVRPGDRIALWLREAYAVRVEMSERVTFEDVTVHASPFFALVEAAGAGGNVYRRCRIVPRPGTTRLIAANGGGIISHEQVRGPLVEDCRFEGFGDYGVGVWGRSTDVLRQEDPRTLLLSRPWPGTGASVGTRLVFHDAQLRRELGSRTVIEATPQRVVLEEDRCAAAFWEGGKPGTPRWGATVDAVRAVLDTPIELPPGAVYVREDRLGSGAVVRRCTFMRSPSEAIRLQTTDGLVEGCRFEHLGSSAITMFADARRTDRPASSRIVIRGNTIVDTNFGARAGTPAAIDIVASGGTGAPHRAITVEDNAFAQTAGRAVFARGVVGLIVRNNRLEARGGRPVPAVEDAFATEDVEDATVSGWTTVEPGD